MVNNIIKGCVGGPYFFVETFYIYINTGRDDLRIFQCLNLINV